MSPGISIDKAQIQQLEKELEKFKADIKHREKENERLREQVTSLRYQIQQSNKLLKDVSQVSDVLSIAIITAAFLFDQCEVTTVGSVAFSRDDNPHLKG